MFQEIPHLEFIPVDSLIIHERHDEQRAIPLIRRMRSSAIFLNPPIVTPLGDGSGKYLVLDGANRTTALRAMGIPHTIAQIVNVDDPGLKLENWNHIVWELSPERFLNGILAIPDIEFKVLKSDDALPDPSENDHLATIITADETIRTLHSPSDELFEKVSLLNALADSYRARARLDRTNLRQLHSFLNIYPKLSGLVIFPNFRMEDILALAAAGHYLPSGITRFTISPRALHLNYPLAALASTQPLEIKNKELRAWIREQIAHKRIRYYAEATFLFDE